MDRKVLQKEWKQVLLGTICSLLHIGIIAKHLVEVIHHIELSQRWSRREQVLQEVREDPCIIITQRIISMVEMVSLEHKFQLELDLPLHLSIKRNRTSL